MTDIDTTQTNLTEAEAERLTRQISARLVTIAENYEAVMPMIREAIERKAYLALGYKGVSDYIMARFSETLGRLGVEVRREVVRELTQAGMSTRAIAPVVGVSHETVRQDQATVKELTVERPQTVTSVDGRQRPSSRVLDPTSRPAGRPGHLISMYGSRRTRVESNEAITSTVDSIWWAADGLGSALEPPIVLPSEIEPDNLLSWLEKLDQAARSIRAFKAQLTAVVGRAVNDQ